MPTSVDVDALALEPADLSGAPDTQAAAHAALAATWSIDSPMNRPDTAAAAGPDHLVVMLNGRYAVFRKTTLERLTPSDADLTPFWNAALAAAGSSRRTDLAWDPSIYFDPLSERWFASALGAASHTGRELLLAVSNSANPLDGWKAFAIDPDPTNTLIFDAPQMGFDAEGVYVIAHLVNLAKNTGGPALVSVPKADLVGATPSIARMTLLTPERPRMNSMIGYYSQPVVDLGPADGRATIVDMLLDRYEVVDPTGSPTFDVTARSNLTKYFKDVLELHIPMRSPPRGEFYLQHEERWSQPLTYSPDWDVMLTRLQGALDGLFGPGNAGILHMEVPNPETQLYFVVFSKELTGPPIKVQVVGGSGSNFYPARDLYGDEMQRIRFLGNITGGSFTLRLGPAAAETVVWDANEGVLFERLRAALDKVAGSGNAIPLRAGAGAIDIKFGGPFHKLDIPQLKVDGSGLEGAGAKVMMHTMFDGGGYLDAASPLQPDLDAVLGTMGKELSTTIHKQGNSFWLTHTISTGLKSHTTPQIVVGPTPAATRDNLQRAFDAVLGEGISTVTLVNEKTFRVGFRGIFESNVIRITADNPQIGIEFEQVNGFPTSRQDIQLLADGMEGSVFRLYVRVLGNSGVRWMEIDATTNRVKQAGNIANPDLHFFNPSLAINPRGDVVVGFTGTGLRQSPSAYYAVGSTVDGYTTFGAAQRFQAGKGSFNGSWGDSSATVVDPTDPFVFYTFQQHTSATNRYRVSAAEIRVVSPSADFQTQEEAAITVSAAEVIGSGESALVGGGWEVARPPTHGAVSLAADGSFAYAPDSDYVGTDSFMVRGPGGEQDVRTVSVAVNPVNDAPACATALGVQQATDESGQLTVSVCGAGGFSAGPVDEADQTVTATIRGFTNASLFATPPTIDADGWLQFTPAKNAVGRAAITFALRDDGGTARGGRDTSEHTIIVDIAKARPNHNAILAVDVTADGIVAAQDALRIINFINSFGMQPVAGTIGPRDSYFDVIADGTIQASDALAVINHINAAPGGGVAAAGEGEGSLVGTGPARSVAGNVKGDAWDDLMTLVALDLALQPKSRRG